MHKGLLFSGILIFVLPCLLARTIDGVVSPQIFGTNQVFSDVSLVKGLVQFNGGITVTDNSWNYLNTMLPLSGGLDIRSEGRIDLGTDLHLASGVTFSTSSFEYGTISGHGKKIILHGPLTIQEGKTVKFLNDTIIDGQGHSIIFGAHAQLYVDYGATLTLKNVSCLVNRNNVARPPLYLAPGSSSLTLDNVSLSLHEDCVLRTGKVFINHDVTITGTSAFVYQSGQPLTINRRSSLHIQDGMTYRHFAPSILNDQLVMSDETSSLVIDNATLQTTHTGMRITRGTLQLHDTVNLMSTTATTSVTGIAVLGSETSDANITAMRECAWSPDGRYVAYSGNVSGSEFVRVLKNDNGVLTSIASLGSLAGDNTYPKSLQWSPDGRFIALIKKPTIYLLKFNGLSLTQVASVSGNDEFATELYTLAWSSNQQYLYAIGRKSGVDEEGSIGIFAASSNSLNYITRILFPDVLPFGLSVSRDGKYLAINGGKIDGGSLLDDATIKVFMINDIDLTEVATLNDNDYNRWGFSSSWSGDSRYVFVGGSSDGGNGLLKAYAFDGSSLTPVASITRSDIPRLECIVTASDGALIAAAGQASDMSHASVAFFKFTGNSFIPIFRGMTFVGNDRGVISFSPDQRFIAVAIVATERRAVVELTYGQDTNAQSYTNSIVFGKSGSGSSSDLNVEIMQGATVNITGKVLYDNVP